MQKFVGESLQLEFQLAVIIGIVFFSIVLGTGILMTLLKSPISFHKLRGYLAIALIGFVSILGLLGIESETDKKQEMSHLRNQIRRNDYSVRTIWMPGSVVIYGSASPGRFDSGIILTDESAQRFIAASR